MAAEATLLRRNGKIRSTDYSVVKEPRWRLELTPSLYNGHFFAETQVPDSKKFFSLLPDKSDSIIHALPLHVMVFGVVSRSLPFDNAGQIDTQLRRSE